VHTQYAVTRYIAYRLLSERPCKQQGYKCTHDTLLPETLCTACCRTDPANSGVTGVYTVRCHPRPCVPPAVGKTLQVADLQVYTQYAVTRNPCVPLAVEMTLQVAEVPVHTLYAVTRDTAYRLLSKKTLKQRSNRYINSTLLPETLRTVCCQKDPTSNGVTSVHTIRCYRDPAYCLLSERPCK
jgi:hypothetical protein